MPRYIDAEDLNLYDNLFMKGKNDSGVWVRYRDVERLIRNAPAADVAEVRHGVIQKVYRGGNPLWDEETVCSLCLHTIWDHFNYCPHCGAKMDEKERSDGET